MSPAQPAHATTTVFVARRILTMNPAQPRATHVAVRDGRILAVGNAEDVQTWGGCAIDETFRDKVLMPGLVEGHCHLMEGAMWDAVYVGYYDRRGPDGKLWRGLTSLADVLDRLREAERRIDDDRAPLLAWGFDPILFGTQRLTVHELDSVSAKRPIAVLHASVHLMNVNGAMLRLVGIDEDTDIDGIVLDEHGRPTGELQEFAAMFPVYQVIGGKLSIAASENPRAMASWANATTSLVSCSGERFGPTWERPIRSPASMSIATRTPVTSPQASTSERCAGSSTIKVTRDRASGSASRSRNAPRSTVG